MVRFVMMIGTFIFVGWIIWALLPGWDGLAEMINATVVDASELEIGIWSMMLVILGVVIVGCLIWQFFGQRNRGE